MTHARLHARRRPRPGRRTARRRVRRAFTLIDTGVTIGTLGVLGCLSLVGLSHSRQGAQLEQCEFQLAQIGTANAQFAGANAGRMGGYTWNPGEWNSERGLINVFAMRGPVEAHAAQAIDILHNAGRPDIPLASGWLPDVQYTPLVLGAFQGRSISDRWDICPSHAILQAWRGRVAGYNAGRFGPMQPPLTPENLRHPYSSSYTPTAGGFDQNQTRFGIVAAANRVTQGPTHNDFVVPGNPVLGPSLMSRVSMPSRKVFMFDSNQRHFGGVDLYYAYAASMQPMLFFDGSVHVRLSGDAATPWNPATGAATPLVFQYAPAAWEPPLASGQHGSEPVMDRFRFTRNGLLGIDY